MTRPPARRGTTRADPPPELGWHLGYPFAILPMAVVSITPYVVVNRRAWI